MHREDAATVKRCAEVGGQLRIKALEQGNDAMTSYWKMFVWFANSHLEPIEKFGRYPTRNKAMGRESTPEEVEFLKNANSWGQ